ncbi:hypothetical protein Tco_1316883 [Tanacetum coccineum]
MPNHINGPTAIEVDICATTGGHGKALHSKNHQSVSSDGIHLQFPNGEMPQTFLTIKVGEDDAFIQVTTSATPLSIGRWCEPGHVPFNRTSFLQQTWSHYDVRSQSWQDPALSISKKMERRHVTLMSELEQSVPDQLLDEEEMQCMTCGFIWYLSLGGFNDNDLHWTDFYLKEDRPPPYHRAGKGRLLLRILRSSRS